MTKLQLIRLGSILVGAGVLFGLERIWNVSIYIALPAGVLAYVAVKVGLGLLLKVEEESK